MYDILGQYELAIKDLQHAVDIEPNHVAHRISLGRYLKFVLDPRLRDYPRALQHLEKACELAPDQPGAFCLTANI